MPHILALGRFTPLTSEFVHWCGQVTENAWFNGLLLPTWTRYNICVNWKLILYKGAHLLLHCHLRYSFALTAYFQIGVLYLGVLLICLILGIQFCVACSFLNCAVFGKWIIVFRSFVFKRWFLYLRLTVFRKSRWWMWLGSNHVEASNILILILFGLLLLGDFVLKLVLENCNSVFVIDAVLLAEVQGKLPRLITCIYSYPIRFTIANVNIYVEQRLAKDVGVLNCYGWSRRLWNLLISWLLLLIVWLVGWAVGAIQLLCLLRQAWYWLILFLLTWIIRGWCVCWSIHVSCSSSGIVFNRLNTTCNWISFAFDSQGLSEYVLGLRLARFTWRWWLYV